MQTAFNLNVPDGPNANPNQKTFLEYLRTKNLTLGSTISELVDTFPFIESATVTTSEGNEKSKIKAIPSSSLEIKDVERLFNVYIDKDFDDDDEENPDSSWIPDSPGETQASTKWLETVLDDLQSSETWRFAREVAVDLVIFDRLKLVEDHIAPKKLRIAREFPMETWAKDSRQNITSCVDYVLGYGGTGRKDVEIGLVAVELRKRFESSQLSAQLVCYMVGLQQKQQQRTGMSCTIYGIQADGSGFLFVRLDGDRNIQTASVSSDEKSRIYKYTDIILKSVISSSPYTTTGGIRTGVEFPLDTLPEEMAPQVMMMGDFDGCEYILRCNEDGKMVLAQVEEDCEDDEE